MSRFVLFQGFHGTDDLHYALLAANMLKGRYDPFQPGDIFSGRIMLVAWQALLYKAGGINLFMTAAGTVAATIVSCMITVTRLLPVRTAATTLVASCLFYFSPPLTNDITGISPDPYIMLVSTIILLLLKIDLHEETSPRKSWPRAVLIGMLIAVTLLIKETIIIFLPFTMLIMWLHHKQKWNSLYIFASFIAVITLMGWGYHYFTGNAFFKFSQVENSAYPNPCNFSYLPLTDLLARLTYGVWRAFTLLGFYPFVLGGITLITVLLSGKNIDWKEKYNSSGFMLLLLLGLYLPFSWRSYQPLCAAPRHFYFLLPSAVVFITTTLYSRIETNKNRLIFTLLVLLLLIVCLSGTSNKWQWMVFVILFAYFALRPILKKTVGNYHYAVFSGILFLSILEPLFFNRTGWFKNLQRLNKNLHAQYFYFPDHDNMMHWKLLHGFEDRTMHAYNIEKHPYKVYKLYYEEPNNTRFQSGWLIINKVYTTCSATFINRVDSLQQAGFFSKRIVEQHVEAVWMDKKEQYEYIKTIDFRKR